MSPRQSSPLLTIWACRAQLQTDGLKQYKLLRLAAKAVQAAAPGCQLGVTASMILTNGKSLVTGDVKVTARHAMCRRFPEET